MSPPSAAAPFRIMRPAGIAAPVVFDSPHSGFEFPPEFRPVASRAAILTTWDAYVDELWADAPAAGATLLAAHFPRAFIDANRAANDIEPDVLETPWPEPVELSDHSRRGMGLIRRLALPGVPMYDRRLTIAEVSARIDHFYAPYRGALRELTSAAWDRHGVLYHFNCHSMKSRGNAMNRDRGAGRPDFAIGDRDGSTARPALTRWVGDFFAERGYRVKLNDPYRGADIVRAHGDPARHCHSIQIEINRSLYMDETTFERNASFASLRAHLADFAVATRALALENANPSAGKR